MALIAIPVWCTQENQRTWLLEKTLETMRDTVNHARHRVYFIDNASEPETGVNEVYDRFAKQFPFTLLRMSENLGTAKAVNQAWLQRNPGEHCVKADSDISIEERDWCDRLVDCVEREPKFGLVGLKRPDLMENPWRSQDDWYRSELVMLPHTPGSRWLVVEKVNHLIGTCQLYSSDLLDKIGYLYQFSKYGYDDSLAAARATAAGFFSAFYPHIAIHHLDRGDTPYQKFKEQHVPQFFGRYHQMVDEFLTGKRSVYFGPNGEQ